MALEFCSINDFPRGILYQQLADAYSFDPRCAACWATDWKAYDDYFFDHPSIAERYGFITVLNSKPIGHIAWDPRNRPAYVQIGHNCILTAYKGHGYGKQQLLEAIHRIKRYEGLQKIIVETNSRLIAPRNYESVGFKLRSQKENDSKSAFAGGCLEYEMLL